MIENNNGYSDRYVSSNVVRSLVRYLEQKLGADYPEIVAKRLDESRLNDSVYRFPASVYVELMDLGARALHDVSFGFHYGQFADANRWGLIGFILAVSDNLKEVLETQQRLQSLVGNIGCTIMHDEKDEVLIEWFTETDPFYHLAEEALAGWVGFGRRIVKQKLVPRRVMFRHKPAGNLAEYEAFFECPVLFNQNMNGLAFHADLFDMPLRLPDKNMFALLHQHAGNVLQEIGTDNLQQQVKAYLVRQLPRMVPTIENVAEKFDLSVRTLQRRFESWGTNYKQFVDLTRKELALRYLQGGGNNLLELTFMLGFSEQSAFHRAFKRWTDCSPGRYLKQVRNE